MWNNVELADFLRLRLRSRPNLTDCWYNFSLKSCEWELITEFTAVTLVGDNRTVILRTPSAKWELFDLGSEICRMLVGKEASPTDVNLPPRGFHLEGEVLVEDV